MTDSKEYEVSVCNIFEATSPEDAVRQMVAWLVDTADRAGYRVENVARPSDTVFIDAEDIDFDALDEDEDEQTYKIKRFRFQGETTIEATGLTLDEAQEWCQREDTHGDGWFDGYEAE